MYESGETVNFKSNQTLITKIEKEKKNIIFQFKFSQR